MSVPKGKRGESDMEFINNARKLQIYTIQKCASFPKRYTFYISQPIAAAAARVYEQTKKANSIFPANEHEVQLRRDCLIKAYAELTHMVSQVEVANEIFGIKSSSIKYWMDLIETEMRLVKGTMKKDKERYKKMI